MKPFRNIKNSFHPSLKHGFDPYGDYSVYSLLIASLAGFAYMLSNDGIEEKVTPFEIGGYVLYLQEPFYKIFATCQGYHIEIDTKADHNYDATGLGRIHKFSVPSELGLSSPIVSNPKYILSIKPCSRNVAIGPGWGVDEKKKFNFFHKFQMK